MVSENWCRNSCIGEHVLDCHFIVSCTTICAEGGSFPCGIALTGAVTRTILFIRAEAVRSVANARCFGLRRV